MARSSYRFGEFELWPSRRVLLRSGREVPLIPRYFDLLLLLLERRGEAVARREILEVVWSDVVVSDGALSQAIRTLRRALEDDVRSPRFIRTHSRHGYNFVYADVIEQQDTPAPVPAPSAPAAESPQPREPTDEIDAMLEHLLAGEARSLDDDERREAAERLHALNTAEALRRLDGRPGHEAARALLRDARWDVPQAAPVPLLGRPGGIAAFGLLIELRLRRAARLARSRWVAASTGGAAAGACAGVVGGVTLWLQPGSNAAPSVAVGLGLVGALIGGLGAAGVGAGLAAAEALARSLRGIALVSLGAVGGGAAGAAAHTVGRWTLEGLFGKDLSSVGGGFEGLVIGAAVGLGYALSTPRPGGGGMATPRGGARLVAASVTATTCAAAFGLLALFGGRLGGASLDVLARSFQGSQVGLAPIASLLGETGVGPWTHTVIGALEGAFFGFGIVIGLTRRPR